MNTKEFVFSIIAQTFEIPVSGIFEHQRLVDVAPDSIKLFELLMRMERELGRSIKYEEIAHIETVGDIIATLSELDTRPVSPGIVSASFNN